jgi:hypothetical protein
LAPIKPARLALSYPGPNIGLFVNLVLIDPVPGPISNPGVIRRQTPSLPATSKSGPARQIPAQSRTILSGRDTAWSRCYRRWANRAIGGERILAPGRVARPGRAEGRCVKQNRAGEQQPGACRNTEIVLNHKPIARHVCKAAGCVAGALMAYRPRDNTVPSKAMA